MIEGARISGTFCVLAIVLSGLCVAVVACSPVVPATPAEVTPSAIVLPTLAPSRVAHGRQVYLDRCASCHGQNAEGTARWQQVDAIGNLPPPPHDDSGHTWRHSDAQLAEIIREGLRDPFNKSPELTMPPFGDQLHPEQIEAVTMYFKSLWSEDHRRYQEEQNRRPTPEALGGSR